MPRSLALSLVTTLIVTGICLGQVKSITPEGQVDDTKKLIDQKDIEIYNLKEELEYLKKELRELQYKNTSLRDSMESKQTLLENTSEKNSNENYNLRIYHQTIEEDRRLNQGIVEEIQSTTKPTEVTLKSHDLSDDATFRERYNEALNQYFDGNLTASQKNFKNLLELRQDHPLSDNCQYWLGECLYSQEKYEEAVAAFQMVKALGDGNKADAALFKIGLSYLKLDKKAEARTAFNDLINYYPKSDLVPKAYQYLISQEKF
ncbi:MAG TPA: tetratricopeptide repeat protein [Candidatus Marinimicrobia bacterium]|nr:tetratricopeptide repeat protein [Candidatus Neomarinimicrobiota bacterium]HRS51990.1 tetratricopeptide repeat protein [Candidatus Neomarinimicrobiota bacterium]HRU91881.1 tetratricopeptide repeat protein [Candidatus Neomarinimicrobiota bacterium]